MLDAIEQRILGVLIEKEATVPDAYPLTENSLRLGCNQSNNRDPVMGLTDQDMALPLRGLMEQGWASRVDGSGRTTKWRHKTIERLGITKPELCVLCELLLRGPQAPGALKPRVARLGYEAEPHAIEETLQRMAARPEPLVVQLPLGPRERDRRWAHRLGGDPCSAQVDAQATIAPQSHVEQREVQEPAHVVDAAQLTSRVAKLEQDVAELRAMVETLLRLQG